MKIHSTFIAACMALATLISALPQSSPSVPSNCPFDPAGTKNVGNGDGEQFIGAQCLSDADCASGCCTNPCGICSGPDVCFATLGGSGITKNGCGFPLAPDGGKQCILHRSNASDAGSRNSNTSSSSSNSNNNGSSNNNNGDGDGSATGAATVTVTVTDTPPTPTCNP